MSLHCLHRPELQSLKVHIVLDYLVVFISEVKKKKIAPKRKTITMTYAF